MARRHKLWAKKKRAQMVLALGGKCRCCGTAEDLTFDCIVPQGHTHHSGSAPERICFYRKQMRNGNLQLLCAECNSLKGESNIEVWCSAAAMLLAELTSLRPAGFPGRGTKDFEAAKRSLMREILASLRENETVTSAE